MYAPLGPTHQAIEDIAILRSVPNMTIVAPCDAAEMRRLMGQTLDWQGPIYIRLAKGGEKVISSEENGFSIGKGVIMREPGEVLFVTTGIMTQQSLLAAEHLEVQGISSGILHCHTIKPLDKQLILELASNISLIVTVEEHRVSGGLGTAVLETLHAGELISMPRIRCLGIPDQFVDEYGSQESVLQSFGLSPEHISRTVRDYLN